MPTGMQLCQAAQERLQAAGVTDPQRDAARLLPLVGLLLPRTGAGVSRREKIVCRSYLRLRPVYKA